VDAAPQIVTHWTDAAPGIRIAEEVLTIAAVVAALAATVVTDSAAASTLALAIGFAAGVMAVTVMAIEWAGENKAPSITAAVLDATAAIAHRLAGRERLRTEPGRVQRLAPAHRRLFTVKGKQGCSN
jgi:hypothetical protein